LQDDAIANRHDSPRPRGHARKKIVADLPRRDNRDGTVEHSVAADVRVFVDKTIADVRFSPIERFAMMAFGGSELTRGLVEEFDGVGKCEVGIGGTEAASTGARVPSREMPSSTRCEGRRFQK